MEDSTEPPGPAPEPAEGRHLIQQAEVPPLDVDGVQAASVGTVLFALATLIMALAYDQLEAAGDGWWLGVAVSGLALGLISLAYTIRRRRRRRRRPAAPDADSTDSATLTDSADPNRTDPDPTGPARPAASPAD